MTTQELEPTDRTRMRRKADRGSYERALVDAILDEALVCHVGVVSNGTPLVLPTLHVRVGDHLYLHGAVGNHFLKRTVDGPDACVTVTLIDGVVFARSAFHHSVNYRSAVLFGRGELVTDVDEKRAALDALVDHVASGRSADARGTRDDELRKTAVVRFPIDEASAKVRTGGPIDDDEDLALPVWAGVVPLRVVAGTPVTDDLGVSGLAVPAYASGYTRPGTTA